MLPIASTVMMQSLTLWRFFQVHAFSREFNSFWVGKSSLKSMALKSFKKETISFTKLKKKLKSYTPHRKKSMCVRRGGGELCSTRVCKKKVYLRSICLFIEVVLILLEALKGTNAADTLVMKDFSLHFRLFFSTKIGRYSSSLTQICSVPHRFLCASHWSMSTRKLFTSLSPGLHIVFRRTLHGTVNIHGGRCTGIFHVLW